MKTQRMDRGFTLIELLVVISIIVLLISILIPSLGVAREKARKTTCAANLSGMGKALHMYADENNNWLPNLNPPNTVNDPSGTLLAMQILSGTYGVAPKIFHCPSSVLPLPTISLTSVTYDDPTSYRMSYDFYSVYWLPEHGPKYDDVEQAPLVWDLIGGWNRLGDKTIANLWQNHGLDGGNVMFASGNAEWQNAKEWDDVNWPHPAQQYYR